MFQALQKRMNRDERGFTLIELMVVVLIIAILIAIAIPTFLGAREKAQDRAAQSDLRQGLLTAKTYYVDNEQFDGTAADFEGLEPSLDFDVVANASETVIGFAATDDDIVLVKQSSSGDWFCIAESETAGTTYDEGTTAGAVDTVAECVGASW